MIKSGNVKKSNNKLIYIRFLFGQIIKNISLLMLKNLLATTIAMAENEHHIKTNNLGNSLNKLEIL